MSGGGDYCKGLWHMKLFCNYGFISKSDNHLANQYLPPFSLFSCCNERKIIISLVRAGHMAELVDALVSGTSGATLGSSSLLMPTNV